MGGGSHERTPIFGSVWLGKRVQHDFGEGILRAARLPVKRLRATRFVFEWAGLDWLIFASFWNASSMSGLSGKASAVNVRRELKKSASD